MGEISNRIIDADVHNAIRDPRDLLPFLPKVWHEQWLSVGINIDKLYYSPVGVMRKDAFPGEGLIPGCDPEFLIRHHMDRYHIDYAILTGSNVLGISLNPDPDYANAVVSAYNDWLIEVWLKHSRRFKGSMLVNHADPQAAAEEIRRVGDYPDIVQVLMSGGSRMLYGQRWYHPIYEAAQSRNLKIAIHPGTEGRGTSGPPTPSGYPTRYMEWHNILPANYMSHINSMVCEGVFEKYPGIKLVAIEGGIGWLPHLMWRMDKNYKALRDTVPWLKKLPSEYIKEHVYLTTQPIEEPQRPEHLALLLEMSGMESRVMFSSDYPHWDFDNPRMALAAFDRNARRQIRFDNAAQLYGIGDEESL